MHAETDARSEHVDGAGRHKQSEASGLVAAYNVNSSLVVLGRPRRPPVLDGGPPNCLELLPPADVPTLPPVAPISCCVDE